MRKVIIAIAVIVVVVAYKQTHSHTPRFQASCDARSQCVRRPHPVAGYYNDVVAHKEMHPVNAKY